MSDPGIHQTRTIRIDLAAGATLEAQLPNLAKGTIFIHIASAGGVLPHPNRLDDLPQLEATTLSRINVDGGGSQPEPSGPTREVRVELLRAGVKVASTDDRPEPGFVNHELDAGGDLWALRLTRTSEGRPRQYELTVQYPSLLTRQVRRIPMAFFERGVAENWDSNPALQNITLAGQTLSYQWADAWFQLYHRADDPRVESLQVIETSRLGLPTINGVTLALACGSEVPEGESLERPFFAIRVKGHYAGDRNLRVIGLDVPFVELPIDPPDPADSDQRPAVSFTLTCYLKEGNAGAISFDARVRSVVLDALDHDVHYPEPHLDNLIIPIDPTQWKHVNLKDYVVAKLYGLLGGLAMQARFDTQIRPFLVGRSQHRDHVLPEKQSVTWLPNDILAVKVEGRTILIEHVGPPRPRDARLEGLPDDLPTAEHADPRPTAQPARPHSRLDRLHPRFDHLPMLDFQRYPPLFDAIAEVPAAPPPASPVMPEVSPGALAKIEHIVVLMQENRSFDQVLGYLSRDGILTRNGRIRQDHVDGLLPGANPRDLITHNGTEFRSTQTTTTAWPPHLDGPCHGHACVVRQIDRDMHGFVSDFERHGTPSDQLHHVMDYYTDAELPAYAALTREFAICDRWFCSFLGGTLPNRFVSLTGGLSRDRSGNLELENPELGDGNFAPLRDDTFFDHLTRRHVSWTLFEHHYSTLRLFRNFTFDEEHIVGFRDEHNGFVAAARAGTLPAVSFIEPDYIEAPGGNDDHAPADMFDGQRLIATIMNALLSSNLWEKTLFIITYDEHGGFYDHVKPPTEVETTAPDGTVTRTPIPELGADLGLGLRVPAFVISPLIPPMTDDRVNVSKALYDHTTIPATILRAFCAPHPPYMGTRMAAAADLGALLTLDTPRPLADFADLAVRMRDLANSPPRGLAVERTSPALQRPDEPPGQRENFHAMLSYASAWTGRGT